VSSTLFESISRIARHEAGAVATAGLGQVSEVFASQGGPPDHSVTVKMLGSGLILPRVPVAVPVTGFAAIPAVGELVVLLFTEGDRHAPIVVGRLYHHDQDPPQHGEGEVVLRLPSGAAQADFDLVITGDPPALKLKLPGELAVAFEEGKASIEVGGLHVTVDGAGGGRVDVAAGSSSITLKKDGDITVSAGGNLKLEGTEVEVSGSAKVKITGAQVDIN
jgi:uncharacterized protein involved in type VI secretion and phage assembly